MISYHGKANTLGLRFSGSMTASISHEIKNTLAIINESAGLLNDLALLAENGRPLSPERLKTLATSIMGQVQRADDIVRRLNRFAHSAIQPFITTDVREIFDFTVALVARLATMNGATITVAAGKEVQVHIRPFVLENLLWIYLKNLFALTTGNKTVEFGVEDADSHVVISLLFGDDVSVAEMGAQVAEEGQPLLLVLRAETSIDAQRNLIHLRMPKKFEE
jgi:signal transduction histidine kinase